jgi:hypothetical protein
MKELIFTDDGEIYMKDSESEFMPYVGRIDFLSHSLVLEGGLINRSRRMPDFQTRAECEAWVRAYLRHPHTRSTS